MTQRITNTWKYIATAFIVLTLVFAVLFGYYFMQYSTTSSNYQSLLSKYESQQFAIVLGTSLSHWNYISAKNLKALIEQYSSNATLNWVGGALHGVYRGESAIQEVWQKFFALWSAVWFFTLSPPVVSIKGNNAKVTALVQFTVKPVKFPNQVQYLNINYTLDYTYDKDSWLIFYEEWRVAGIGFHGENQQSSLTNLALANAFLHWNAISTRNATLVMQQYAKNATLFWIGGALNGTYVGYDSIMNVWNKFFNLWSAISFYSLSQPTVILNGNTVIVNATIQFVVQRATNMTQFLFINVGYSITYKVSFDTSKGVYSMQIVSETYKVQKIGQLY
jgi:ketosteroid isomerase-like protein